eukprot:CAMPEP_0116010646 /NCGR_PEP_ID=MMETSP0321-20121206/4115_1 /TAXON_ID=163516 /ORGANISM="Leptocylindrus danicus var. danicus, Strain B650" /LENGTH=314 /DNA_ID=CAMNT_0003479765 /DNA_START=140 /DNA_END=1084 /DNA_ORIENTATION=+
MSLQQPHGKGYVIEDEKCRYIEDETETETCKMSERRWSNGSSLVDFRYSFQASRNLDCHDSSQENIDNEDEVKKPRPFYKKKRFYFGIAVLIAGAILLYQSEIDPLEKLYLATNGTGWYRNDYWMYEESESVCIRYGVVCRPGTDDVIELNLGSNGLSGSLPTELALLRSLERLYISSFNGLAGTIPTEYGKLKNMQSLTLSGDLTGPIPTELGKLEKLRTLRLSANELTGTIPTELGNLKSLESLFLENNDLDGTIPRELGQLKAMTILSVKKNDQLYGPVPQEVCENMPIWLMYGCGVKCECTRGCDEPCTP